MIVEPVIPERDHSTLASDRGKAKLGSDRKRITPQKKVSERSFSHKSHHLSFDKQLSEKKSLPKFELMD